jgi:hypothetical protein
MTFENFFVYIRDNGYFPNAEWLDDGSFVINTEDNPIGELSELADSMYVGIKVEADCNDFYVSSAEHKKGKLIKVYRCQCGEYNPKYKQPHKYSDYASGYTFMAADKEYAKHFTKDCDTGEYQPHTYLYTFEIDPSAYLDLSDDLICQKLGIHDFELEQYIPVEISPEFRELLIKNGYQGYTRIDTDESDESKTCREYVAAVPVKPIEKEILREANKGVNMKLFERCYKESDEYDTDKESGMIILDRRGFATLQCDSLQDHTFYIENDGNFIDKFYADSPEDAIKKFQTWHS